MRVIDEWLKERLPGEGWVGTKNVSQEARENGFSVAGLRESRKRLGVKTRNNRDGSWDWRPDQ